MEGPPITGRAYGYIHRSISTARDSSEVDTNDNRTVLGVRVNWWM